MAPAKDISMDAKNTYTYIFFRLSWDFSIFKVLKLLWFAHKKVY